MVIAGIDARNKRNLAASKLVRSGIYSNRNGHAPWAIPPVVPSHRQKVHPYFRLEAHREGAALSWKMQRQKIGRLVAVSHVQSRRPRPHFRIGGISLQYADCLRNAKCEMRNEGECSE